MIKASWKSKQKLSKFKFILTIILIFRLGIMIKESSIENTSKGQIKVVSKIAEDLHLSEIDNDLLME